MKVKDRERHLIDAARREAEELAAAETAAIAFGPVRGACSSAPEAFEGYEVHRAMERGGQGVVYRAVQKATGRDVAIKVLREGPFAAPLERARFEREVRILGQLRHPNIVCIHDSGEAAGHFFYVMDYIVGQTLDVFLANHPLPSRDVMRLFLKICRAVAAAHARGIIHRDLKPQNIRIGEDGEPQVLDFGLAKLSGPDEPAAMTVTGLFLGSLPWASPEQTEGRQDRVGLPTDVYGLGVMLYQMVSGEFPYEVSGDLMEVMTRIRTDPPRPLRRVMQGRVDRDVETIIRKAMEKEPERRYQSAGEMARDVERWLANEPISARTSTAYVLRKQVVRHRVLAGFVGMLLLFGAVGTSAWVRHQFQVRDLSHVALAGFLDYEDPFRAATPAPSALDSTSAALDRGAVRSDPRSEVRLRELLSISYLKLERIPEALDQARKAHALCRIELPASDREHAYSAQVLGRALFHDGQLQRSEHFYREGCRLHEEQQGAQSPEYAACLHELAGCVRALGRFAEAEHLLRVALSIRRDVLEPDDEYIAASLNNLAVCLIEQGQFEEAELLLLEVWERVSSNRGFPAHFLIRTLRSLAVCRLRQGDVSGARRRIEEAMAIEGGNRREQAMLAFEQGRCAYAEGSFAAAEDHFRNAVEIHGSIRSSSGRAEANEALAHLGVVLIDLGRLDEAERALATAADGFRRQVGETHPAVAFVGVQRARVLMERGRLDEAEAKLAAALEVQRANLRDDHPDLRLTERLLADLR